MFFFPIDRSLQPKDANSEIGIRVMEHYDETKSETVFVSVLTGPQLPR